MFRNNHIKIYISLMMFVINSNDAQLLKVQFSSCEQKFRIVNQHLFGYPIKVEILMCRCDCDRNEAAKLFSEAFPDFELTECATAAQSSGFCITKEEEEMSIKLCPQNGYAYCLMKLTPEQKYKSLELRNWQSYWRIHANNNQFIDIPPEIAQFIHKSKVYQISSIDIKCAVNQNIERYFVKSKNNDVIWKAPKDDLQIEPDLTRFDWFDISNQSSYFEELRKNIDLRDDVCQYRYTEFSCSATGCQHYNSENDFGEIMKFDTVTFINNNVKIVTNAKLSINSVQSENAFYFNGEIRRGDDGNQYLVIFGFKNKASSLSGFLGFTTYETVVILNNEYVKLKKTYSSQVWACLHPDDFIELKTCRLVDVNNNTVLYLTTTIFGIDYYNARTNNVTNITNITKENSEKDSINLGIGVWITIALVGIFALASGVGVLLFYKRRKMKQETNRRHPIEDPPNNIDGPQQETTLI